MGDHDARKLTAGEAFRAGEAEGYHKGVREAADRILHLEACIRNLNNGKPCCPRDDFEREGPEGVCYVCRCYYGAFVASAPFAVPAWADYEIDTDDVCTVDGFDGICLTTGEINVATGLRMSAETARQVADRLHAWLVQRRTSATGGGGT